MPHTLAEAYILMFSIGLIGLMLHRNYLLTALLCLEAMMLAIYISMALYTSMTENSIFSSTPLMVLSFSACEAAVGLALLVSVYRTHGTTNTLNINMLQC
uniref:NADH-ubiquinone oxidoreductase chain 4L n=1 Tax=Cyema atrum TaxID=556252 RepID=D1YUE6_9TELE|nr:NADH dehydrogenase subunit 4L [Cyema atrum]BAI53530.1 NADH dehydrogenase subunit 4L [Cyema atrum]